MDCQIDFVVTWVNGQDPKWQRQKANYSPGTDMDDNICRYREWELFYYWFRGVERFAPWVRTVHLVTEGHLPDWLDTSCEKLRIVTHEDIIPEQYLPIFNSNAIEMWLHKIEGLSEHFVYFNDDMFLMRPTRPEDFFYHGKPCDMLAFQPVIANPKAPVMSHLYLNNILVLCKYFNKRENVRRHLRNYFHIGMPPLYFFYNLIELAFPHYTGLYTVHGPSPFCKATFEELWRLERPVLERCSANRFRSETDVTQYLFREWQKLTGNFCPRNIKKLCGYYEIGRDSTALLQAIRHPKKKILCLNDVLSDSTDVERLKIELYHGFESILSEKSVYEK